MARPVAERSGFTVPELMVALVLTGILASVMYQVMSGQGRFVEVQSAREEVQQNARVALELIGSELRTVPGRGGIEAATATSLTLRAPRVWGVVCSAAGTTVSVTVPQIAGASYAVNVGTHAAIGIPDAAGADSVRWTSGVRVTAVSAAGATCDGRAPSTFEGRTLTLQSTPATSDGITAQAGNLVYLYDQVSYQPGTSSGVVGTWIMRRVGSANFQPMAGPITSGSPGGFRLQYYDSIGTQLPAPLSAADRRRVTRVQMVVRAESRAGRVEARQWQEDTVVIAVRNRR